jgi:regulator of cell morphogenesis and NO signaling
METRAYQNITLGEMVVADFRTASVFKKAGLDFCCGGKKSLEQACMEKNIDIKDVMSDLQLLESTTANQALNFKEWKLNFLSDYIVNTHHQYVYKTLPELMFYTKKIASVHGDHHPELKDVAKLFDQINTELLQHLKNEEEVLFPAIKEVLKSNSDEYKQIIKSEIDRMTGEHEFAGGAMDTINQLTKGYEIPEDACNTYRVSLKLLEQFEDDLHVHVHLENNILYPKALQLA